MNRTTLERCLLGLSRLARRHSGLVIASAILLFLGSLGLSWAYLEFHTNRDDLVGSNDLLYETQQKFIAEFPITKDVVVIVEEGSAQQREAYVELLAGSLREHEELFYGVFPKVELPFLTPQALMFLPAEELEELVAAVENAGPFLKSLGSDSGLEELFLEFERAPDDQKQSKLEPMLPFLNGVFAELSRSVDSRGRAEYRSPWGDVLFSGQAATDLNKALTEVEQTTFYHTLDQGRTHLLMFRLKNSEAHTIKVLRNLVSQAHRTHPDLRIGVTGEPLLEHDEMVSSEEDSHRSAVLSLLLVGILFSVSFRQIARPLTAIFCLALAVGWTVGFTTLSIGHLNLLTISFATILIGLGIDFGIHLLFRYEEEFQKTGQTESALDEALLASGSDIVVGALSTATAFWAVGLTEFKGVSEIGIIAGSGVMFCLLSTLIVLPALIAWLDRKRVFEPGDAIPMGSRILLARGEAFLLKRSRWVLGGSLLFLFLAWPSVASVGFDYNLLRLQDPSLESVQTELTLIEKGGNTVLFAVAVADDVPSARLMKIKFEALSTVARVDVVSDLFPERTERKVASLRELESLVGGLNLGPESQDSVPLTGQKLQKMGHGFESLNELFESERPSLLTHKDPDVRAATQRFEDQKGQLFEKLESLGPGPIEDSLGAFQSAFFADLFQMVNFLQAQDPDFNFELEDLPENLKMRSVGQTGKLVLRIYPKENIWERAALQAFVDEVREAEPESIGAPVMILHHTSILKGAFETSGVYAMLAVTVLLLLYFRSVLWTLLALFPLALGVFFMLFVMGRTGVHFNPANFMGLPLLMGIGLDFGIHVLHRVKEEGKANMFDHSTGPATAVSGLTTICGFGTLALGGHQGVASLGLILAAGVSGILLAALVVLPALLQVFWKSERVPVQSETVVGSQLSARSA